MASTSGAADSRDERAGWGSRGPVATLVNELIDVLRPTEQSDRRRRGVFRHIASLVDGCFAGENVLVTAFGSVPLRTYLPDGDIDVCLLGPHELLSARDDWTTRLRAHVERAEAAAAEAEDESSGSTGSSSKMNEFAVSEIHIIHAEVKLMKLICDGVVVDVSANQFGGLAALGFLEEVNAFIGKDEIFKRSIVLIKAWGFYEGRLLGAHHALISTYALETLVLYILNRFHRELSTPLEVLHKFLVFFATFDWDNNAVSVVGPIPLDDLDAATGPIGKRPEVHAEGALLTPDFMWRMMDKYGNDSVTAKLAGTKPGDPKPAHRPMARKYLNVVDPLLSSNNLGRSVSQGNAKRIRKALALGAKRLTALRESSTGGECFVAVRMLEQFFGNTMRHRRLGPMPHLPMAGASTPAGFAGRNHADEVSMTPARCPRTGAVSVLASPSSPSQYQSPLPPARDSPVVGSASSRMATKGTEAPAAKVAGRRPTPADDADGGMPARRLEMTSPRKEGGDGGGSDDAVAEDHWPHLERVGTRCPVLQRAEKAAAAEKAERDLHGEERGPFWGRWDPLPASEAIAQHARAFATSEGFPTTHSEGMAQGGKGGRCPVLAAAAREEEEVVASAIPSGCPFHFESRREADERRMDPIESTHAARSDGSSDESSKEAKSASPTGPLSDGDGEGKAADVKPADEKPADVKPAPPPPPPGPPPPAHRARTSMDGAHARMRREMSCPTFFPEPEQRIPPPPPPAPPSKPGPAVLPPRTAGDDDGKPITDVFTGDLEAIWSHLQFGRAYHHLAIVHMRSFGAMGGTETRGAHGASQQRYGGRKGGGGAVAFNRRQSRDGGGRGGHARSGSWGAGGAGKGPAAPPPPPPGAPPNELGRRSARQSRHSHVSEGSEEGEKPAAAQRRGSRDGRGGRGVGGARSRDGDDIPGQGAWSKAVSAKDDPPPLPPGDPPPLPPGPPPPGTRTSMDGGGVGPVPVPPAIEQARPSWGPKKTAPMDAIRAPPNPPPTAANTEETRDGGAKSKSPPAERKQKGPLANAKGLGVAPKGSWSSLVAAGGSPSTGETSTPSSPARGKSTAALREPAEVPEKKTSAPPSPARPLAGAWAKGNGKDALAAAAEASRVAAAAAITVHALGKDVAKDVAKDAGAARRSRASSSSGDSNAGEKENSSNSSGKTGPDGGATVDESYLHKVEEFPTLGGKGPDEAQGGGEKEKAGEKAAWGSGENPWSKRAGKV